MNQRLPTSHRAEARDMDRTTPRQPHKGRGGVTRTPDDLAPGTARSFVSPRVAQKSTSGPRLCAAPDCSAIVEDPRRKYCSDACRQRRKTRAAQAAARGRVSKSSSARGYGAEHRRLRKRLAPKVAAGLVCCARCGDLIVPGSSWDLGHRDGSSEYSGPEHSRCNRGTNAAGRVTAQADVPAVVHTRVWR